MPNMTKNEVRMLSALKNKIEDEPILELPLPDNIVELVQTLLRAAAFTERKHILKLIDEVLQENK